MAITTLEKVKLILGINDTSKDSKITALIPMMEEQYLEIRRKHFDTDQIGEIVYPKGSELTVIKMIEYTLRNLKNSGIASQSLGDFSISYENIKSGSYPDSITKEIKKYIKAGV
jgi:hypothetical protein